MIKTNKRVFFCIDFEDWYHIPYLSKYGFSKDDYPSYLDKIDSFVDWLDENSIIANFFVVGDIAYQNSEFLKKCKSNGHLIGCHSMHHLPINKMTNEEFINDTRAAKEAIEKALGDKIFGYRAPFFSMTNEKLLLLKDLGFSFDSSYIQSNANEYYEQMTLNGFARQDSLIFKNSDFYEYEIPTLNNKPIAGGGFFRLYPLSIFKKYVKKFSKKEDNYVFFIHPFEIAGRIDFGGLRKMNFKDKIRFQLGRKNAERKLKKALLYFKNSGYIFSRFGE